METVLKLEIIDYSEKAIVVAGDTREIKDELFAAGGKFNRFLNGKNGKFAGWVFSKRKQAFVENIVARYGMAA